MANQPVKTGKKAHSCACVRPDAGDCYRARCRRMGIIDDDIAGNFECECCCHHKDEDGRTEWD